MIQVKEKEIDGAKYCVTQMTARVALKTQARLIKLFGNSIGEALSAGLSKSAKDQENALGRAIASFSQQLDEKTFDSILFDLLQNVRKNGMELTPSTIDLEFAGNLNSLFKVVGFVLEANFSDFLEEGGIIRAFLQPQENPPPTQS